MSVLLWVLGVPVRCLSPSPASSMRDPRSTQQPHPDLGVRFVTTRARFAHRRSVSSWFLLPPLYGSRFLIQPVSSHGPRWLLLGRRAGKGVRPGLGCQEAFTAPAHPWKWDCVLSQVDLPEIHLLFIQKYSQMGLFCPQFGDTLK